jgi:hypothetical protein
MDLDRARHRIAELIRHCDQFAAEVFARRRRCDRLAQQHAELAARHAALGDHAQQLAGELAHARATIANMERSLFWQVRLAWVRIRRPFGSASPRPAAPPTVPAAESPPDPSRP